MPLFCYNVAYSILVKTLVQFSHSVVSNSFRPQGLQHARLPCPSPTSWSWLKLMCIKSVMPSNISSSVIPYSCPQAFPASESFPMSRLFSSGGQRIGASASNPANNPSSEYSALIFFRIDWFDLAVQGTLKFPLCPFAAKPTL